MEILATAMVRATLHGAVAIAAVWAVCRLFPRIPASLRCGLWWLACLKLLVALVWVEPIPLAVLPAAEVERRLSPGHEVPGLGAAPGEPGFEPHSWGVAGSPATSSPGVRRRPPVWPLALAGLWGAGLLFQLGLTARQLAAARRIARGAEPVSEPWITALFAGLRERLGVRRAELLASPEVETPQVSGAWQPRVLLPRREIGRLSPQELSLTLAHELLHVRRGDLWLGWVPALAQRLFFFHPLAALAAREYALAREAACDAAVLHALDPAPDAYGRLLLRLGVAPRVPRLAAAGAAPTFQTLKRRLEMLQQSADKKSVHRGWWGLLALLALVVLIPIQIVAQAAPPEPPAAPGAPAAPDAPNAADPGEPAPPVPPVEPVPPAAPGEPVPTALPTPPTPPTPATLPVVRIAHMGAPPVPPAPPAPPVPPVPPVRSWSDDDEPWVLLHDEKSVTMSGSGRDVRDARKHYSGKPLLWFERNGKTYVIKDQATVARAQALFEPQTKLGDQQSDLGDRQSALGDQQSALGDQQSDLGDRMSDLGDRLSELAGSRSGEAEREKIEGQMEELGQKMEALGRQMEALGRQQEALGRQQEELGRQQEKIAREGERQLRSLVDQAISSGVAKEV